MKPNILLITVILSIFYPFCYCSNKGADLITKLALECNKCDATECLYKLVKLNKDIKKKESKTPLMESAKEWMNGYLIEQENARADSNSRLFLPFSTLFGIKNISPSPGCEFYLVVDKGILIFNHKGDILGKIDISNLVINGISFIDLDDDSIFEVVVKFTDSKIESPIIHIYKITAQEAQMIFEQKFTESYVNYRYFHAVNEQIFLAPFDELKVLITNDEGKLRFYKWLNPPGIFREIDKSELDGWQLDTEKAK
jgi:hypothetical protein